VERSGALPARHVCPERATARWLNENIPSGFIVTGVVKLLGIKSLLINGKVGEMEKFIGVPGLPAAFDEDMIILRV
jgi:hypothetical protein